ncbi:Chitin synthase [Aphelenchoides fujianensis]|nr:Chitin synthase [Aphelenchoides fujianensis]
MQKDCLHIEWPFGPKFNHTIVPCNSDKKEQIWVMSRLQLEPIGLLFLVFYMSILVIQFVAMLLHRFSTLEHIIASTELFFLEEPLGEERPQRTGRPACGGEGARAAGYPGHRRGGRRPDRRETDQPAEGRPGPRILPQIHEQEADRNAGRGLQTALEQPSEEGGG